MANQQGFSAKDGVASLDRILRHFDRSKMYDENGDLRYVYYPNLTQRGPEKRHNYSEIDPGRTHLNYNLAPERDGGQRAFVERRLGQIYVHKSALANAIVDWVVTLPDMEQYRGREREFFESAYSFLVKRYGEENVVSAYVHMDEVQPHMHFVFVPVVPDEKHRQGWKLSKKEVNTCERIGKNGLPVKDTVEFSKQFHEALDAHIEASMGVDHAGIVLTEEQRGKRRIKENMRGPAELRRASAELDRLESEKEAAGERLAATVAEEAAADDRLERLRREEKSVASEIAELEKAAMEPVDESIAASAGALIAGRGSRGREEDLGSDCERLRERIEGLERDRDEARSRISILERGIAGIRARIVELGRELAKRAASRVGSRRRGAAAFARAREGSEIADRERRASERRDRRSGIER